MSLKESVENNYWFQFFEGRARERVETQGAFGPVLGFNGVFGGWPEGGIRKYLKEKGVAASLVYLGTLTNGIDSYVAEVAKEIKKRPGALIIAFSASGLVVLRYAQLYGWNNFKKVISIATPFQPVPAAENLKDVHQFFKDFSTESPILSEILNLRPPEGKALSLFASKDVFTPKPESVKLNWPSAILDTSGHSEIQENYKLIANILDCELGIRK